MTNELAVVETLNRSMAKDLSDLLATVPDVLTSEEQAQYARLQERVIALGQSEMSALLHRSNAADALYDLQQEEDWKLLSDPQSGNSYRTWAEFREVLAVVTGISTGTIGHYLRLVRLAREVLGVEPGEFRSVGGLITVGHIDEIASFDGRSAQNLALIIRPKTAQARETLDKYEGEGYAGQLKAYFDEIKHDYEDPSATNLPRKELGKKADEVLGRPSFSARRKPDDPLALIVQIKYADYQEDGVTIVGETDETIVRFDGYVNPFIRGWVEDQLGIK